MIILFDAALLVQRKRCRRITQNELLSNYGPMPKKRIILNVLNLQRKTKNKKLTLHLRLSPNESLIEAF